MAAIPPYRERQATFDKTPTKTDSPNPSNRAANYNYVRFERNHSGWAQGVNYTPENNEMFQMSWTGTGTMCYNNGEWECRLQNGGTVGGYGGMQTLMGGNIVNSSGGSNSTRSTGSESHVADAGTGVGGGGQAESGKPLGTSKHSADKSTAHVYPESYGLVAGETLGIAAGRINMKANGNFAMGSTDGSGSFTSKASFAVGSQEGTCQVGGKGVTLASDGGGISMRAKGGNFSAYSQGGNFIMSGGKVYINCSNNPPETPGEIATATGKAGELEA